MAITLGTPTNSGNQAVSSSFSFAHTLAANSKCLVVVVTGFDSSATDSVVSSVVWDSVGVNESLTQIAGGRYRVGSDFISIWYKSLPSVLTSKNITVTMGGTCTDVQATAIGLIDATANSIVYDSFDTGTGTGSASGIVSPAASGSYAVGGGVAIGGAPASLSVSAGAEISGSEVDMGSQTASCATGAESGGAVTITWSYAAVTVSALVATFKVSGDIAVTADLLTTASALQAPTVNYDFVVSPSAIGVIGALQAPGVQSGLAIGVSDDFNDNSLDTGKWTDWGGAQTVETNQQLEITSTTGAAYYGIDSASTVNLTNSAGFAQLVNAGNQSIVSLEVYPCQFILNSTNSIKWVVSENIIKAFKTVASTSTQLGSNITYSSSTHKWFRIREAGGTVYWDWSTTGSSWTNHTSELVSNLFAVTALKQELSAGTWQAEASTTTAIIDNYNTPPSGTSELVSAGANTAASALQAPTIVTNSILSPSALGVIAALQAPSVIGKANVTADTLAAVAALQAPTIVTSVVVSADALGVVASLQTPVNVTSSILSPSALGAVAALQAPTIITNSIVSAGALSSVVALQTARVIFLPYLTNLYAWYAADYLVLSDNDTVGTWTDLSGNSRDLTQGTTDNKPIYKTGIINSLPIVRFDGSNDYLQSAGITLAHPYSLFIVYTFRSAFGSQEGVLDGVSQQEGFLGRYGQDDTFFNNDNSPGGAFQIILPNSFDTQEFHYITVIVNGASSSIRFDGGTPGTGTLKVLDLTKITLGAHGGLGQFGDVDIAEVIYYSEAIGSTDRADVEAYLDAKYFAGTDVTVTADLLTAASSLQAPTVTGKAIVTADALSGVLTLQTPTVTTRTDVTVSADRLTAVVAWQSLTVSTVAHVTVLADVLTTGDTNPTLIMVDGNFALSVGGFYHIGI